MAARRAVGSVLPSARASLTRSFAAESSAPKSSGISHQEITHGDGHHGLRPGYNYDWEHGAHYIRPDKIPNFHTKWNIFMPVMFATALGIPVFAVWWQKSKMSG